MNWSNPEAHFLNYLVNLFLGIRYDRWVSTPTKISVRSIILIY